MSAPSSDEVDVLDTLGWTATSVEDMAGSEYDYRGIEGSIPPRNGEGGPSEGRWEGMRADERRL